MDRAVCSADHACRGFSVQLRVDIAGPAGLGWPVQAGVDLKRLDPGINKYCIMHALRLSYFFREHTTGNI